MVIRSSVNILNRLVIGLRLLQSKRVFKKLIIACYVMGCRKNNYQIMWSSGGGGGGGGAEWANYVEI